MKRIHVDTPFLLYIIPRFLEWERTIKKFFVSIIFAFALFSCAAPFGVYHRVKKNETLYSIAKLYGTSVDNLQKNNNIADAKRIQPGDYIFVPGVSAPLEVGKSSPDVHSNVKTNKSQDADSKKTEAKQPAKKQQPEKGNAQVKANTKPGAYIWPTKGVVTSQFGSRWGKNHSGIDIGCPEGTQVYASAAGSVVFAGEKGGYGLLLIISHPDGSFTIYAHNSKLIAKEGAKVKQGEKIALSGNTGRSTGPHLHFEIRQQSKAVDPLKYLP